MMDGLFAQAIGCLTTAEDCHLRVLALGKVSTLTGSGIGSSCNNESERLKASALQSAYIRK
jgi:hypothetical protein